MYFFTKFDWDDWVKSDEIGDIYIMLEKQQKFIQNSSRKTGREEVIWENLGQKKDNIKTDIM